MTSSHILSSVPTQCLSALLPQSHPQHHGKNAVITITALTVCGIPLAVRFPDCQRSDHCSVQNPSRLLKGRLPASKSVQGGGRWCKTVLGKCRFLGPALAPGNLESLEDGELVRPRNLHFNQAEMIFQIHLCLKTMDLGEDIHPLPGTGRKGICALQPAPLEASSLPLRHSSLFSTQRCLPDSFASVSALPGMPPLAPTSLVSIDRKSVV